MIPKVFFVARTRNQDVSSVLEHGETRYLLERPPSPFKVDECVAAINDALDEMEYEPGVDFIGFGGSNILLALLVAVAAGRGPTRILLWDAPGERYIERELSIHNSKKSA